jgi:hypothetical protein
MKVAIVFENLEGASSIAELKEQFDGTDEQIKAVFIAWFVTAHPQP